MESLSGKKAIITGGSKGVGKAIALALAEEGVEVGLIARHEDMLQEVVAAIHSSNGKAHYAVANVADYHSADNAAKELEAKLGRIDILINNAAVAAWGSTVDMDVAQWETIMHTNVFGVYYITKALLPKMIANRSGDIVTIASSAGLRANANAGAYSASKFAVIGFMEALVNEVRQYDIRVSTIAPTTIVTGMAEELGLIRNKENLIQPEDIAEFVVHQLKMDKRVLVKTVSLWATNP